MKCRHHWCRAPGEKNWIVVSLRRWLDDNYVDEPCSTAAAMEGRRSLSSSIRAPTEFNAEKVPPSSTTKPRREKNGCCRALIRLHRAYVCGVWLGRSVLSWGRYPWHQINGWNPRWCVNFSSETNSTTDPSSAVVVFLRFINPGKMPSSKFSLVSVTI
jgi:hypothetical protein